jgi:hypothetical protein
MELQGLVWDILGRYPELHSGFSDFLARCESMDFELDQAGKGSKAGLYKSNPAGPKLESTCFQTLTPECDILFFQNVCFLKGSCVPLQRGREDEREGDAEDEAGQRAREVFVQAHLGGA